MPGNRFVMALALKEFADDWTCGSAGRGHGWSLGGSMDGGDIGCMRVGGVKIANVGTRKWRQSVMPADLPAQGQRGRR